MNSVSIKELTDKELIDIMNDDEASERDIILASIEKGERDYEKGIFYTTEEVKKIIFERSSLVKKGN